MATSGLPWLLGLEVQWQLVVGKRHVLQADSLLATTEWALAVLEVVFWAAGGLYTLQCAVKAHSSIQVDTIPRYRPTTQLFADSATLSYEQVGWYHHLASRKPEWWEATDGSQR